VEGINVGKCFVFDKLDGTNASVWMKDGILCAGSRNRKLSLEKDNGGFYKWVMENSKMFISFFLNNPNTTLYGEWLITHSFKNYREECLRKFYVFDVAVHTEANGEVVQTYIPFDDYHSELVELGMDVIYPIMEVENGDSEDFNRLLSRATFCVKDGVGAGEGIVIKNYNFCNRYGRTTWAKIVRNEFKEMNKREFKDAIQRTGMETELNIASKYVTRSLAEKEYEKMKLQNNGFTSKNILEFLNRMYHSVVSECCWEFVKENKDPTISFKVLKNCIFKETRAVFPDIF